MSDRNDFIKSYFGLYWLIVTILVVIYVGCEDQDYHSNPEFAIPILHGTINAESMLDNVASSFSYTVEEDNKVTVKYTSDISQKRASEVLTPLVYPDPIPFLGNEISIPFSLIDDSYSIDQGVIGGQDVWFGFTNEYDEPIDVIVRFVEASKEGGPFEIQVTVPILEMGEIFETEKFDLEGYDYVAVDKTITFNYEATLQSNESVVLEGSYLKFNSFYFEYADGNISRREISLEEQAVQIDIFESWQSGLLEFADPTVNVYVENSFGFPSEANVHYFRITNLENQTTDLQSTIFESDMQFEYPSFSEIGHSKTTKFVFDTSNSNFATAVNKKIKTLDYKINAVINPDNDNLIRGFFLDTSYYKLYSEVVLPLHFRAEAFTLRDELEFNNSDINFKNVDHIELKTILENQIPVDISVQIYLKDELGEVIDSLFEDGFLDMPRATIDQNGKTISEGPITVYMNFGTERIDLLKRIEFIEPLVVISTAEQGQESVWIRDDQGLDVKMGAKLKLNMNY